MPENRASLNASASVTLDASGNGQCQLGPQDSAGPSYWQVDTAIVQTTRPGVAPIPTIQLYVDTVTPANSQGLDYDGSFNTAVGTNVVVRRGSHLIAVWTGGAAGDVATLTVTGIKW
jgi:hypothetical protein